MTGLKARLVDRLLFLSTAKEIIENEYASLPGGKVSVRRHNGRVYYYLRINEKGKVEQYLSKTKSQKMIQQLSQKEYCAKTIKLIDAETKATKLYLDNCPCTEVENVSQIIDPALSRFVSPVIEDDKTFLERWIESEYEKLDFDYREDRASEFSGFRSKSEFIIANKLSNNGIPFKYEKRLNVDGVDQYPDFTLLDIDNRREIYWEHFGMMDNEVYVARAMKKINLYSKAGLIQSGQMIITMESSIAPIDIEQVDNIINMMKSKCCLKD